MINKLHESVLSTHHTFVEIKERLIRLFGHTSPMSDDYADRANEVAQLALPAEFEEGVEEVRERLACVQLGLHHIKRVDI